MSLRATDGQGNTSTVSGNQSGFIDPPVTDDIGKVLQATAVNEVSYVDATGATVAQGTLADSALQPGDIGITAIRYGDEPRALTEAFVGGSFNLVNDDVQVNDVNTVSFSTAVVVGERIEFITPDGEENIELTVAHLFNVSAGSTLVAFDEELPNDFVSGLAIRALGRVIEQVAPTGDAIRIDLDSENTASVNLVTTLDGDGNIQTIGGVTIGGTGVGTTITSDGDDITQINDSNEIQVDVAAGGIATLDLQTTNKPAPNGEIVGIGVGNNEVAIAVGDIKFRDFSTFQGGVAHQDEVVRLPSLGRAFVRTVAGVSPSIGGIGLPTEDSLLTSITNNPDDWQEVALGDGEFATDVRIPTTTTIGNYPRFNAVTGQMEERTPNQVHADINAGTTFITSQAEADEIALTAIDGQLITVQDGSYEVSFFTQLRYGATAGQTILGTIGDRTYVDNDVYLTGFDNTGAAGLGVDPVFQISGLLATDRINIQINFPQVPGEPNTSVGRYDLRADGETINLNAAGVQLAVRQSPTDTEGDAVPWIQAGVTKLSSSNSHEGRIQVDPTSANAQVAFGTEAIPNILVGACLGIIRDVTLTEGHTFVWSDALGRFEEISPQIRTVPELPGGAGFQLSTPFYDDDVLVQEADIVYLLPPTDVIFSKDTDIAGLYRYRLVSQDLQGWLSLDTTGQYSNRVLYAAGEVLFNDVNGSETPFRVIAYTNNWATDGDPAVGNVFQSGDVVSFLGTDGNADVTYWRWDLADPSEADEVPGVTAEWTQTFRPFAFGIDPGITPNWERHWDRLSPYVGELLEEVEDGIRVAQTGGREQIDFFNNPATGNNATPTSWRLTLNEGESDANNIATLPEIIDTTRGVTDNFTFSNLAADDTSAFGAGLDILREDVGTHAVFAFVGSRHLEIDELAFVNPTTREEFVSSTNVITTGDFGGNTLGPITTIGNDEGFRIAVLISDLPSDFPEVVNGGYETTVLQLSTSAINVLDDEMYLENQRVATRNWVDDQGFGTSTGGQTEDEVNVQIDAIRTSATVLTFPNGDTFTGGGTGGGGAAGDITAGILGDDVLVGDQNSTAGWRTWRGLLADYEILLAVGTDVPGGVQNDTQYTITDDLPDAAAAFSGLYGDLTGTPTTFAPAPHTHILANITDSGDLAGQDNLTTNQINDLNLPDTQLTQAEVQAFADQAYVRSVQDPNTDVQLNQEQVRAFETPNTTSLAATAITAGILGTDVEIGNQNGGTGIVLWVGTEAEFALITEDTSGGTVYNIYPNA